MYSSSCASTQVISKYFAKTPINQGMDDSSDFQEPKKSIKVPKQKQASKTKVKKTVKKSKGQKDIRQVLKNNKNDLVAYSKDFDNVCKKSGIDIDSEQLQLAIALSKSLHSTNKDNKTEETQASGSQNSQDRTNKIRTTLLEYGFKVPEIKINTNKRKRKFSRSNSRLLLTSEAERQQIIADKYSQIIFDSLKTDSNTVDIAVTTNSLWYNLTSNKTYSELIDDDIFYLNELNIERSCSVGSSLKDWSQIPGRPASPKLEKPIHVKISEITLTSDEVDILLSGVLDNAQRLIRIKTQNLCKPSLETSSYNMESHHGDKTQQTRCLSPDIFDESEVSHSLDISSDIGVTETIQSQTLNKCSLKDITKRKSDDFMDLTECVYHKHKEDVPVNLQPTNSSQVSSNTNFMHRNSNDLMEITECIQSGSEKPEEEHIDLTQGSDSRDDTIILQDNSMDRASGGYDIDLTQSSYSNESGNDSLPAIKISGTIKKSSFEVKNDVVEIQENGSPPLVVDVINVDDDKDKTNSKKSASFEDFNFNHSDENVIKPISDCDVVQITELTEANIIYTDSNNLDSLGQKHDVSIDYDDLYNNITNDNSTIEQASPIRHTNDKISSSYTESNELDGPASQSEVFEISDEEFNYSIHKYIHAKSDDFHSPCNSSQPNNFDVGGVSTIMDELSAIESKETNESSSEPNVSLLPVVEIRGNTVKIKSPVLAHTPTVKRKNTFELVQTPNNSEYIMKTDQVTPMQDFAALNTPGINKELEKYGLKPFKRKRAIQLLTHLYDQTHPVLEDNSKESPVKKKKTNPEPRTVFSKSSAVQNEGSRVTEHKENDTTPWVVGASVVIGDIPCDPADWVFQKREKAKLPTCRLPLHVAFHNHVASSEDLRTAILRYQPVDIDEVHRSLAANGHKYDAKDLLKFMDKRCITVKTADNNARNKKNDKK